MIFVEKIRNKLSADPRAANAHINTVLMLAFRGMNILISFLYVPLLIHSLNEYKYGIWLTITSIVAWFNLLDIGLGNGLRNRLTEALAQKNKMHARVLISTAYASLFFFTSLLIIIFLLASEYIDWCKILNVPSGYADELTDLINIVVVLFLVQLFFSIINSILFAFQRPFFSTLVTTLGQLLSFGAVCCSIYVFKNSSLVVLGLLISASPILILCVMSFYILKYRYKEFTPSIKYINFSYLPSILNLGIKFFYLQIVTIILYQTSNLIIARTLGQAEVAEYNIIYKYIGVINMIFTIIVLPYWSATTDAYAKSDFEWIQKSVKRMFKVRMFLFFIGGALVLISKWVYSIWLGNSISVNYVTTSLAFIYFVLNMAYVNYGMFLNGIGKVKIQIYVTTVVAALFIPFSVFLSKEIGLNGIFISLSIVALINFLWSYLQYSKIINGKAQGIWLK